MGTPSTSREPCPDRILDDIGGAFAMGSIGGTAFHFLKGIYNSPKGERFIGGSQAVRMNAPRVGGGFGVWGGLFSTFDCTMVYLRQKEDPWNSIFAGAAAGGFLQMRHGLPQASRSALFGGCMLALIEGAGIMVNKLLASQIIHLSMEEEEAAAAAASGRSSSSISMEQFQSTTSPVQESSSSWFGGLFGGSGEKKKEEKTSETKILESFDTPSMPIPSFDYDSMNNT